MSKDEVTTTTHATFKLRNLPAALSKAIGGFATNGVNILQISSEMGEFHENGLPATGMIQIVVEGSPDDEPVARGLEELQYFTSSVEIERDPVRDHSQASSSRRLPVIISAAQLSDTIRLRIDELKNERPNSEDRKSFIDGLISKYEEVEDLLNGVLTTQINDNPLFDERDETLIGKLKSQVTDIAEFISRHEKLKAVSDVALIGGCHAFLVACQLPIGWAAPVVVGSFAGPRVLRLVEAIKPK